MSASEMTDRLRQQLSARIDWYRYRLDRRIEPELRPAQRSPQFFFSRETVPGLCNLLRERFPQQAADIIRRAERVCRHRFDLLGYENLNFGPQIDWHLDVVHNKRAPSKPWFQIRYLDFEEVGDSKVTWELNRHQHLVTLAKAYRLSGRKEFADEIFRQWRNWHTANPYPIGINWSSSLEVAFRSLSWIWMYFLLEGTPAMPAGFRQEWLRALFFNGRHIATYLSTYFSPNTHLLGEGVGLFFIGAMCPEIARSASWQQQGWDIVVNEARRQVHADGLHFEQSVYYHVYALDFFLHAAVLGTLNNLTLPNDFERTLERMLDVLVLLGRAGAPPAIGDDDGGRLFDPSRNRPEHMLDPLATGSVLFARGDFKYLAREPREETLWLLGEQGVAEFDKLPENLPNSASVALPQSGFYVMAGTPGEQLVVDAGPQGSLAAGHGHADALSVCVNSGGRALLVDPGACAYVTESSDRDAFRSTASHNTLVVDGCSQADPRGPFGWSRLPRVKAEGWISGEHFDLFVGSHDGYTRLGSPVVPGRWVFSLKSQFWCVRDVAAGAGEHQLELWWHVAPDLVVGDRNSETFVDRAGTSGIAIVPVAGQGWSHDVRKDWISPVYGRKERATVLHFGTVAQLPAEFVTLLIPLRGASQELGRLERVRQSSSSGQETVATEYRYQVGGQSHHMFFSQPGRTWTAGPWKSDAEFLYWSSGAKHQTLICCNASYVEFGSKSILSFTRPVLRCEIVGSRDKSDVICSEPEATVNAHALWQAVSESETVLTDSSAPASGT
jgi:hypothetical protein